MTANKHTPGPWVPASVTGGWDGVAEAANRNSHICALSLNNPANARLIAAAPELLEILRKILPLVATQAIGCHGDKCREEWCFSCNGEEDAEAAAKRGCELFAEAHSLIAKATGGAA